METLNQLDMVSEDKVSNIHTATLIMHSNTLSQHLYLSLPPGRCVMEPHLGLFS